MVGADWAQQARARLLSRDGFGSATERSGPPGAQCSAAAPPLTRAPPARRPTQPQVRPPVGKTPAAAAALAAFGQPLALAPPGDEGPAQQQAPAGAVSGVAKAKLAEGGRPSSGEVTAAYDLHNALRAAHGTPPLAWAPELAASAASFAAGCPMKHSNAWGDRGESLAWGFATFAEGVQAWYNEVRRARLRARARAGGRWSQQRPARTARLPAL